MRRWWYPVVPLIFFACSVINKISGEDVIAAVYWVGAVLAFLILQLAADEKE